MTNSSEFFAYIEEKFTEFVRALRDKYNIPDDMLREILKEEIFEDLPELDFVKDKSKKCQRTLANISKDKQDTCCAIIKTGRKQGESCGAKISDKSISRKYCGRHLKADNEEKHKDQEITGLVFRRNKFGNYAFGDTGLILKNDLEKIIIGKQRADGTIDDLAEEDIQLCIRRRLKHIVNYSQIRKDSDK